MIYPHGWLQELATEHIDFETVVGALNPIEGPGASVDSAPVTKMVETYPFYMICTLSPCPHFMIRELERAALMHIRVMHRNSVLIMSMEAPTLPGYEREMCHELLHCEITSTLLSQMCGR